jgi:hypothetical protein
MTGRKRRGDSAPTGPKVKAWGNAPGNGRETVKSPERAKRIDADQTFNEEHVSPRWGFGHSE